MGVLWEDIEAVEGTGLVVAVGDVMDRSSYLALDGDTWEAWRSLRTLEDTLLEVKRSHLTLEETWTEVPRDLHRR